MSSTPCPSHTHTHTHSTSLRLNCCCAPPSPPPVRPCPIHISGCLVNLNPFLLGQFGTTRFVQLVCQRKCVRRHKCHKNIFHCGICIMLEYVCVCLSQASVAFATWQSHKSLGPHSQTNVNANFPLNLLRFFLSFSSCFFV